MTFGRSNTVQTPNHQPGGIHLGTRWNHGAAEPTLIELEDGRVWMILRTAQDDYYESFSSDYGESWSQPVSSRFHGTITMPCLKRLQDGRILFLSSNTTPLPELARATGRGEDVFTNRDVHHAAISEDEGKTWIGFREIILDEHRNDGDYAVTPGSNDRGKHQSEVLELGDGKVLIALGQHPLHRKLVILDIDWLYETTRSGTTRVTHHRCRLLVDGNPTGVELPLQHRAPDGLSYVHFISNADATDEHGVTLRRVQAKTHKGDAGI